MEWIFSLSQLEFRERKKIQVWKSFLWVSLLLYSLTQQASRSVLTSAPGNIRLKQHLHQSQHQSSPYRQPGRNHSHINPGGHHVLTFFKGSPKKSLKIYLEDFMGLRLHFFQPGRQAISSEHQVLLALAAVLESLLKVLDHRLMLERLLLQCLHS